MKKLFTLFLLAIYLCCSAQIPADLKFDKNLIDSENHWVVLPNKDNDVSKFSYGFLYFDESGGGYSMQQINDFSIATDGKFISEPARKNGFTITRIGNGKAIFSPLSDLRINEMALQKVPEFLKNYNFVKNTEENKVQRASALNGMNNPALALQLLLAAKKNKFISEYLYFELAYAYNALGNFDETERIIDEAEKNKFLTELIIKEKLFALIQNKKVAAADLFLKNHLSSYKTDLYKEEGVANMIVTYNNIPDKAKALEWIAIYLQEFPNIGKYKDQILKLQASLETAPLLK